MYKLQNSSTINRKLNCGVRPLLLERSLAHQSILSFYCSCHYPLMSAESPWSVRNSDFKKLNFIGGKVNAYIRNTLKILYQALQ